MTMDSSLLDCAIEWYVARKVACDDAFLSVTNKDPNNTYRQKLERLANAENDLRAKIEEIFSES